MLTVQDLHSLQICNVSFIQYAFFLIIGWFVDRALLNGAVSVVVDSL
jgi:hypothetical protein